MTAAPTATRAFVLFSLQSERRCLANLVAIHSTAIRLHEARIAGHRSDRDAAEREVERIDGVMAEIDGARVMA